MQRWVDAGGDVAAFWRVSARAALHISLRAKTNKPGIPAPQARRLSRIPRP